VPAIVLAADGEDEPAPLTGIVSVGPGDRLALPADTAYTARQDGGVPAVALVAVILPAGEGDADPAADIARDAVGLTVQPLGEGVAAVLPPGRAAVTLERFVLTTGLGVPSYPGPVLVAVEAGGFASTLDAGDIQLAPAGRADAQPTVAPGQAFAVATGDAVFFPEGMEATPPLTGDGDLVLLRLGILPLPAASSPAGATDDGTFAVGATVVVTTPGLRLRAMPMTDGAILAELAAGQLLVVTGPPATGTGLIWYPVQDPNNPAVTGFVAANFVAPLD
nr:SH3 domain-containing protein [Chloroflexia bacterium]